MLKLITALSLIAAAAARPGLLGTETSLQQIGAVISSIPTSITHQSQTQIHSSILAPAITSIAVPVGIRESRPLLTSEVLSTGFLQEQKQDQVLTGENEVLDGRGLLINNENQQALSQDQIDQEQRLLTLISRNENKQALQQQILDGRTLIAGNQGQLLINENGSNQKISSENLLSREQLIGNGALSLNGQALIGINGNAANTGLRLDSLK